MRHVEHGQHLATVSDLTGPVIESKTLCADSDGNANIIFSNCLN